MVRIMEIEDIGTSNHNTNINNTGNNRSRRMETKMENIGNSNTDNNHSNNGTSSIISASSDDNSIARRN